MLILWSLNKCAESSRTVLRSIASYAKCNVRLENAFFFIKFDAGNDFRDVRRKYLYHINVKVCMFSLLLNLAATAKPIWLKYGTLISFIHWLLYDLGQYTVPVRIREKNEIWYINPYLQQKVDCSCRKV